MEDSNDGGGCGYECNAIQYERCPDIVVNASLADHCENSDLSSNDEGTFYIEASCLHRLLRLNCSLCHGDGDGSSFCSRARFVACMRLTAATKKVLRFLAFANCVFLNKGDLGSKELGCAILKERKDRDLRLVKSLFDKNTAPFFRSTKDQGVFSLIDCMFGATEVREFGTLQLLIPCSLNCSFSQELSISELLVNPFEFEDSSDRNLGFTSELKMSDFFALSWVMTTCPPITISSGLTQSHLTALYLT
jgi:hypothetical protein